MQREIILQQLGTSPDILKDLLKEIPSEIQKIERIQGKWSIHEHACHIVVVQSMLTERAKKFIDEDFPKFIPYIPGKKDDLINLKLEETLNKFEVLRKKFVDLLKSMNEDCWHKKAKHPEYKEYNPYILARHVLLHDYVHMYRIEELFLTKKF